MTTPTRRAARGNYGDLVEVGPELSAIFGPQFWTVAGHHPDVPGDGQPRLPAQRRGASPFSTNWPQDRAVQQIGWSLPARYVLLSRDGVPHPPSTWYAFDAGRDADLRPSGCLVRLERWCERRPARGRRRYQWTPSSAQYQWLQQDLAAHPNQIKMAAFHYPLYSDQKHETSDTFLHGPDSLQGLSTSTT